MGADIEYILRVIDFETTGIPSEEEKHSVCEFGLVDVSPADKTVLLAHKSLVQPTTPMSVEAQAVHHISETQANTGIEWASAKELLSHCQANQELIFVAHNADYEKQFFDPEGAKWIDTYKVALKLYPDAPRHTNQVLKYYLGIKDCTDHHPPHRALPDCQVTAQILVRMAEKVSFNDMIRISREPPYLTKITFGKHYGKRFDEVPKDYLQWILGQDMDEGVKAAANRILNGGAR